MLKSPINGLCVIELLSGSQVKHVHAEAKDSYLIDNESQNDFQAIQTIECKQDLTAESSDFQINGREVFMGKSDGTIICVDLLD